MPPTRPMSWALVTGAAARGGAAIARALHARGLAVVIHHSPRSADPAAALAAELEALRPGSTRLWCVDFATAVPAWPAELDALGIEVLVCNASVYRPSAVDDAARAHEDLAVHLHAHAAILAAMLPRSPAEAPALKSVVAVTDVHVERPPRGYVWYTVAKAALQSLIGALAVDFAPRVRFNVVQPGAMPFPADWADAERAARIEASIPMRRLGRFEELARAVVWLALDAEYVTGQVLAVDGGRTRHLV